MTPLLTVAVDINPAESALLELKIAAIKHLSYDDYLLVLGDKEDTMQIRCKIDYCNSVICISVHFKLALYNKYSYS